MRVVGGKSKGQKLKGAVAPGARPTTERVRAAIFNILQGEPHQQERVLDLFAGTGSLGIEALSRGASWADFVERDRRQCQVIQSNLETTGFSASARVYCADVDRSLATLPGPYELVLLDPPYRMLNLDEVLGKIGAAPGLVAGGGKVVAGHSKHLTLSPQYGFLSLVSHRRYGDNVVDFYVRESSP
jgi:16S rRNA (guanine(966)-N(2))-methyltransferase RsmD